VATLILLVIALIPLNRLRTFEHRLSPSPDVVPGHDVPLSLSSG
jgi:hypothetical protein